ncbi:protein kinase [Candidatus Uabimicrobium sp. HlEnr_7]|uniref:serine/threonine protein kinase n=1 Tax=Candidatus Uabimicrobium helgolandensis TaxID=3095367 RepID=UPI0035581D5C
MDLNKKDFLKLPPIQDPNLTTIDNKTSTFDVLKYHFPPIPGYKIEKLLGQGGMGAVFLATDEKIQRKVAIKILGSQKEGSSTSSASEKRFGIEASIMAELEHPGIVKIYHSGEINEVLYHVMEYIEGGTIHRLIGKHCTENITKLLAPMAEICFSLAYAHRMGVIHRDIKPGNILVNFSGEPKIVDFGLAKNLKSHSEITRTGSFAGTAHYCSPEQLDVKNVTPATDQFSLGVVFYQLLTGERPFEGSPAEAISGILSDNPIPPRQINSNISPDLEVILLKMLQKNTGDRYRNMNHVGEDLLKVIEGERITGQLPGVITRTYNWTQNNPVFARFIFFTIICTTLGLVLFATWQYQVNERERNLAKEKAIVAQNALLASQKAVAAEQEAKVALKLAEQHEEKAMAAKKLAEKEARKVYEKNMELQETLQIVRNQKQKLSKSASKIKRQNAKNIRIIQQLQEEKQQKQKAEEQTQQAQEQAKKEYSSKVKNAVEIFEIQREKVFLQKLHELLIYSSSNNINFLHKHYSILKPILDKNTQLFKQQKVYNIFTLLQFSTICENLNKNDIALYYLKLCCNDFKKTGLGYTALGGFFLRNQKYNKAKKAYLVATEILGNSGHNFWQIFYHLGQISAKEKENLLAARYFQIAEKLGSPIDLKPLIRRCSK